MTFVTKDGIVFTVGHFYRGTPVLIENRIPVKVITIAKVLDYFLGITPLHLGATLNLTTFDYEMPIIIKGNTVKHGRVIRPLDRFHWLTSISVTEGESGSPVIDPSTNAIVGYVTHGTVNGSIVMPLIFAYKSIEAALSRANMLLNLESEQSEQSEEQPQTEEQ